jgi:hypothetical protein
VASKGQAISKLVLRFFSLDGRCHPPSLQTPLALLSSALFSVGKAESPLGTCRMGIRKEGCGALYARQPDFAVIAERSAAPRPPHLIPRSRSYCGALGKSGDGSL